MKIPIVNENDEVIGEEERSVVHQRGLLHRETHVLLIDKDEKIIFQKRGLDKDTYPGLLDAAVGGHVDPGETYEQAALRELQEETGLSLKLEDLTPIDKLRSKSFDQVTGMTNNRFSRVFAHRYLGSINDLTIESEGLGFAAYGVEELQNLSQEERKKFIQTWISDEIVELYKKAIKILK